MKNPVPLSNANLLKLSNDLLERGTSIRFRVKGFSMRPFIRDGDFIIVAPVENSSISLGDVVFFFSDDDQVIVHRVIRKYKSNGGISMMVKGDATFGLPDKVDSRNILGKVVVIERNGHIKNLNTKFYRTLNLLFAVISPFSHMTYSIGSKANLVVKFLSSFPKRISRK
ncbi:MAG: signal peptidase I [Deltaproteobacteria bacterium]